MFWKLAQGLRFHDGSCSCQDIEARGLEKISTHDVPRFFVLAAADASASPAAIAAASLVLFLQSAAAVPSSSPALATVAGSVVLILSGVSLTLSGLLLHLLQQPFPIALRLLQRLRLFLESLLLRSLHLALFWPLRLHVEWCIFVS